MIYSQDKPTLPLATDYLLDGDLQSDTLIVLAHGAGANMHHAFMEQLSHELNNKGFAVYRFNFPYMQANMLDGKKRPPDRAPKLLAHLESVLADIHQKQQQGEIKASNIVFVGKSMGSRMMATLTSLTHEFINTDAKQLVEQIKGQVCLGYPFVPIKKGGEPRLSPLNDSTMATLILQGERDKFGLPEQINRWPLRADIEVVTIADGDHSFAPRKSSGLTFNQNLAVAVDEIASFSTKVCSDHP
ncbi:alpha/beta family hydrolase [Shewanella gaetbuli]|uniref:Dienelactone hydrolase n=1 Tax=Shewanella gaetbuli TaxID=220752 RepID=A0A9X2CKG5_9GAMM|nr:dienelactone hydrolase [Shewanella gaetbuli]